MSGQIVIQDTRLVAKQGVAIKTTLVVENGTLDDVEIVAAEGVAFDFDVDTGEITLSCNTIGSHEVLVGFKDEDAQDIIVLDVEEDKEDVIEQPTSSEEPAPTTPEPTPVVPAAAPSTPPVVETPTPVVKTAPAPAANVVDLVRALEEYKFKMDLRALVPTELGIAQQQKLFKTIIKVLNKEGSDFVANMNTLIAFVKENRTGVFSEKAINRFIPQVKMNKEEVQLFTRLTAMLLVTADIEDKKLVSTRIDFRYIEQRLRNGKAMHQLINYFNPASE